MLLKNDILTDTSLLCFAIFRAEESTYKATNSKDDLFLYNGYVEIFRTIDELNEYLTNIKMESIILNSIYRGYLFQGTHFPLDSRYRKAVTLVLEDIGDSKYFVEQMENLRLAANSIQNDINRLPNITDYMVFSGEHINLSLYCNDTL
ncbi:MAG: hypothetical protein GWP10_13430 [Nitrospiraceae bacterium]|nr:hypothetical protein [Nitrospiraceae bacterium]